MRGCKLAHRRERKRHVKTKEGQTGRDKEEQKIRKTPLDKKIEILGLACSMHCKVLLQNGVLFQDGGIEDQPYNI